MLKLRIISLTLLMFVCLQSSDLLNLAFILFVVLCLGIGGFNYVSLPKKSLKHTHIYAMYVHLYSVFFYYNFFKAILNQLYSVFFFYVDYFICLLYLLTIITNRWLISLFNPFIRTFYILN